jgi:aryl-alcohol dehydrogenase-like predicted oxidoreductase
MKTEEPTSADKFSRRTFIRKAPIAAGLMAGALAQKGCTKPTNMSKILNYNQEMGYRPLGRTGLMLSEVGLGGHWKNRAGERYWDEFPNDEVPADAARNRIEVISACIDSGINYLDIGTSAECLAYGVALKGRRDKMIIAADDYKLSPRQPENCTVDKLTFDIDQCLKRLQTDYLDIWRAKADMYGRSTDSHVETMIETFEKARKAGKARHFAISSHRRPWLEYVIQTFSQVEIVSFPCTATTRSKGKLPHKDNVDEVNAGYDADTTQGIFELVRKRNIGVVAIKPFLGGNLFKIKTKFPVTGPGDEQENDLARLTLQCILTNDAITTTIPGLTTVYEVANACRASYTRMLAAAPADKQRLARITKQRWAELPHQYKWLRDWEVV